MQPDTLWTLAIEAKAIEEHLPRKDLPMLFAWLYRRMGLRSQSRALLESEALREFPSLFREFSLWKLDQPPAKKLKPLPRGREKSKVRNIRR